MAPHDTEVDPPAATGSSALLRENLGVRVRREDAERYVAGVGQVLFIAAFVVPGLSFVEVARDLAGIQDMPLTDTVAARFLVGALCGAGAAYIRRGRPTLGTTRLVDLVLMSLIGALVGWLEAISLGRDVYIPSLAILVFVRGTLVAALPAQTVWVCLGAQATALLASMARYPAGLMDAPLFWQNLVGRHMFVLICTVVSVWCVRVLAGYRRAEIEARTRGRYRVRELLGEGGVGQVHRAWDRVLERDCAVKTLRPRRRDPEALRDFEREAKVTGRLQSPHAVRIYDYGETADGRLFFAMELLPGRDLHRVLAEEGPIDPARAAAWIAEAASALREAHSNGLVHRDVKPANLFLVEDGTTDPYVKVLDFGLSAVAASRGAGEDSETGRSGIRGTPAFMAPEQGQGLPPDPQSDVYALGAVLFTLLTGEPVYAGRSPIDVVMQHVDGPVRRPSERAASIPPALDALVARCLSKTPEARPRMDALQAALRSL